LELPHISRLVFDCLSIILIDLLLAGDNALVIAMAVRPLPKRERRIGTIFGAAAAVVLRIAITIVAAQILTVEFIKLVGGLLVIWIAVKVIRDAADPPPEGAAPKHFLQAIWFIVAADITMSTDNVLAIAGASRGSIPLIVFGLGLSIPVVVFSSNLIAVLMDRYPFTVWVGAAILGRVGGEMIATDPFVQRLWHPSPAVVYAVEVAAVAVIAAMAWALRRRSRARK
jgi:YjbE family integral membrane protein